MVMEDEGKHDEDEMKPPSEMEIYLILTVIPCALCWSLDWPWPELAWWAFKAENCVLILEPGNKHEVASKAQIRPRC